MATVPTSNARRERERALVRATRTLFDERGVLDAPIEEIAQSVGIARGLIYRQFSSKEELYVLTVTDYLAELAAILEEAIPAGESPEERLRVTVATFAEFCARYPAFIDSALSLMHRTSRDLHGIVSESVWLRLGRGMASCIDQVTAVLRDGAEAGVFSLEDPDYTSNLLWTQVLGAMHLARTRVGLRSVAPGIPVLFSIPPERVVASCVQSALATVGASG